MGLLCNVILKIARLAYISGNVSDRGRETVVSL